MSKFTTTAVLTVALIAIASSQAVAGGCHSGGHSSHHNNYHNHNHHNHHNHQPRYVAPTRHVAPAPVRHEVALPQFGFRSTDCGHGLKVTYVAYGSIAYRMGLECDDIIVGFCGTPILNMTQWRCELRKTMCGDGHVILVVRKCSGGEATMNVRFAAIVGEQTPNVIGYPGRQGGPQGQPGGQPQGQPQREGGFVPQGEQPQREAAPQDLPTREATPVAPQQEQPSRDLQTTTEAPVQATPVSTSDRTPKKNITRRS